jgi:hypothetical protein
VLEEDGVVAVWGYAAFQISPALDPLVSWFEHERVGRYWPAGRELANDRYRSLLFPYAPIETPSFVMTHQWTVAQFLGYLGSWSAVARARQAEGRDPVDEVAPRLAALWGEAPRDVRWPLHLLVGRRSRPGRP